MQKAILKDEYNNDMFLIKNTYQNNGRLYLGLVERFRPNSYENEDVEELWSDITINLPDLMIEQDNIVFISNNLPQSVTNQLEEIGLLTYLDTMQYNYGRYGKYLVDIDIMNKYLSK